MPLHHQSLGVLLAEINLRTPSQFPQPFKESSRNTEVMPLRHQLLGVLLAETNSRTPSQFSQPFKKPEKH